MADRILFIGWDEVVRGREVRAADVFNEIVGYYGRLQQEGRIEKFNAVFLTPAGNGLQGYFELHGDAAQLVAVRDDHEFQVAMADAGMVVDDLRIIPGMTGPAIAEQMEIFTAAAAKVPQAVA